MIVKESEANTKICPVISFRVQNSIARSCRGKTCMAWREVTKDHGFCGMTNIGPTYTAKEDDQLADLWENED